MLQIFWVRPPGAPDGTVFPEILVSLRNNEPTIVDVFNKLAARAIRLMASIRGWMSLFADDRPEVAFLDFWKIIFVENGAQLGDRYSFSWRYGHGVLAQKSNLQEDCRLRSWKRNFKGSGELVDPDDLGPSRGARQESR